MSEWHSVVITEQTPIIEAINVIDRSGLRIALVVDLHNRLVGTITDGDIRRGLLKSISFDRPAKDIMRKNPKIATVNDTKQDILHLMQKETLFHIPIVDHHGALIGLEILEDIIKPKIRENYVVLMAGGLGTRLSPLTDTCPKPLLKLGNKPMLEIIMDNFAEHGFKKFYICVNYKADMIQDYFGTGEKLGYEIQYIHEDKQLGTAGALSLLPEIKHPIIVMNGDLLTKINFHSLIDYHTEHRSLATMCVKEFDFQVPYGVVRLDQQNNITRIDEKPIQRFFVNAGIYVLDPSMLDLIPKNEYCDMPTLFSVAIEKKLKTISFPIREYWLDIGRPEDLMRAKNDYIEHF